MPTMPIGDAYRWLADQDPDRPAITDHERTITRRELDRAANRLARAYAALGVRQDDFVTVALPNSIEAFVTYAAIWKLGATPQPVSAKLPRAELDAIVELADPSLVVGVEHASRAHVPAGFEPDPALPDTGFAHPVARYWKAPTSGGSTGRPKLIVSANPGEIDPTEIQRPYGERPNGTQLLPGPLYHNAPFSFSNFGLATGNHIVMMPRFDAEQALALIERHRVDWTLMVPTMMQRIWRLGPEVRARYDLSSLNGVLHLAAPCPAWLKQAWIDWLGAERIHELYAGTEAQVVVSIRGDEWLEHPGSVGRTDPETLRILDARHRPVPAGEVGEVFMRAPAGSNSTYHYVGAEARRIDDGWESLGDMGSVDADGFLYLADRQSDMILSGGANVYPAEVEAAIDAHPAVRSSCVIGLPDDDLGNRVHAIVDTAGAALDAAELLAFLGERLSRYKHPRSVEFVDTPVRDDAGKVRRSQLRAERLAAAG